MHCQDGKSSTSYFINIKDVNIPYLKHAVQNGNLDVNYSREMGVSIVRTMISPSQESKTPFRLRPDSSHKTQFV